MSEDRILLSDMVFHGRHGTLQAEHGGREAVGQFLQVESVSF
jgi:hypothetical protein